MVFIAADASKHKVISVFFKEREIPGLTACKPSDIALLGVSHKKELAYEGYKSNIDIFISATSRQMKLLTDAEGARLNLERLSLSPNLTPVFYIPNMDLTQDQRDSFLQKTAIMAPQPKMSGKTWSVTFNKPMISFARRLVNSSNTNINCPAGSMPPASLLAAEYISHILSEFLATQSYPAWRDEENRRTDKEISELFRLKLMVSKVTKTHTITKTVVKEPPKKKTRASTETLEYDIEPSDGEDEMVVDEEAIEVEADYVKIEEAVYVAKPSPLPYTRNVGGPQDVPMSPGMTFPYFPRMLLPDEHFFRDTISSLFLRCLGDSREEQKKVFREIRTGLPDLVKTAVGMEMLHMLVGVRLALETQTRLFLVVMNSNYAGFVLLGAKFSVLVDNEWFECLTAEALMADVALMSSHTKSLESLCKKISLLTLKGAEGGVKEVLPADVPSGFVLWEELWRRVIPDGEKGDLEKDLRMIAYGKPYKTINADNIAWALDLIIHTEKPLPSDIPLYVPIGFNLLGERTLKVLCYFGPDAFSFINRSGTKYEITPLGRTNDPNDVTDEKGRKKLEKIVVAVKGVLTAFTDMQKFLKEKATTMDMKERAKENRCIVFRENGRNVVYSAMRAAVTTKLEAQREAAGEKRKRKRDADDTAPKTAEDFLSLFD